MRIMRHAFLTLLSMNPFQQIAKVDIADAWSVGKLLFLSEDCCEAECRNLQRNCTSWLQVQCYNVGAALPLNK